MLVVFEQFKGEKTDRPFGRIPPRAPTGQGNKGSPWSAVTCHRFGTNSGTKAPTSWRTPRRHLLRRAGGGAGKGVPDEGQGCPRLAAMLRSEAKQDDATLPYTHLGERDLTAELVFA